MIPADILNIYMLRISISKTSSTSPATDLCKQVLEDVEDVEPKKVFLSYLLTLSNHIRAPDLHPVTTWRAPSDLQAYLELNILNIPKTPWEPPMPETSVTFTVYGLPAPQGSKRHVGGGRMIESSAAVKPWREAVKHAALADGVLFFEGPVAVNIEFSLPKPKSAPKRHSHPTKRPDLDKLVRSTLDALTEAGAWRDDSQVVCLTASKLYADPDGAYALKVPGAWISIHTLNAAPLPTLDYSAPADLDPYVEED